jgi:predicted RNA binding protein YcfA (HicA-like mRNA interferase family)
LEKEIIMAEVATVKLPAVVLVHGGFVDGSGWEDTYKILKKDGYNVSIVQNAGSTVVEVKGSHAVYVSNPEAVAALIEKAAKGVRESVAS